MRKQFKFSTGIVLSILLAVILISAMLCYRLFSSTYIVNRINKYDTTIVLTNNQVKSLERTLKDNSDLSYSYKKATIEESKGKYVLKVTYRETEEDYNKAKEYLKAKCENLKKDEFINVKDFITEVVNTAFLDSTPIIGHKGSMTQILTDEVDDITLSRAFKLLMDKYNIKSNIVECYNEYNYGNINHVLNSVVLDGEILYVDIHSFLEEKDYGYILSKMIY